MSNKRPSDCWWLSRDGALPSCSQGLSLLRGAGSVAMFHRLLAESVALLPEGQFWMLSLPPRTCACPCSEHCTTPFCGYSPMLRPAAVETVSWVRLESEPHIVTSCMEKSLRLFCSAGFECHLRTVLTVASPPTGQAQPFQPTLFLPGT